MSDVRENDLAHQVEEFERLVSSQAPIAAGHYDDDYFASDWREGDNRYDLETRRRIEDRNPKLIKDVFAPERVLDVGCGPGFLMALLAELDVEADGVDFSASSLTLAPDSVRERITIGPVTALTAADASYDLVVCREVIEHLTVLQARLVVSELCRVSSRFVYVTTRFHPDPNGLLDVTTQFDVDPTHITLMTKPLLRTLFVLEGFRSRPGLEARLDWGGKGRVLVLERAS
jgi:SAM-dependent methyltransferase